jgi:hypothetical protein
MQDEVIVTPTPPKHVPWNKGKLTGVKPPLRPKHVWAIRTKLHVSQPSMPRTKLSGSNVVMPH